MNKQSGERSLRAYKSGAAMNTQSGERSLRAVKNGQKETSV